MIVMMLFKHLASEPVAPGWRYVHVARLERPAQFQTFQHNHSPRALMESACISPMSWQMDDSGKIRADRALL
jgi:hypothetical protein